MVDNVAPKTARIEATEVKADSFSAENVNFDVQTSIDLAEIIDAVRLISTNEVKAVGAGFKELSRTIEQKANEQLKQTAKVTKPRNKSEKPKPTPKPAEQPKPALASPAPKQKAPPAQRRASKALPLMPVVESATANAVTNPPQQEVISVADVATGQSERDTPAQKPVKVAETTIIQQVSNPKAVDTNDQPTAIKGVNTPISEDFSKYKIDTAGRLRNANGKYASKIEKQRYEAHKAESNKPENDSAEADKQQISLLGMIVKSMAKISVARSDQDNPSKVHQMNAMADSSLGSAIGVAMGGSYFLAGKQILEATSGVKDHIANYLKANEIKTVGDAYAHGKLKAQEAKASIKAKAAATKENGIRLKNGLFGLPKAFSGDKKFSEKLIAAAQGFAKPKAQEQAVSSVTESEKASKTSSLSKTFSSIKNAAKGFIDSIAKAMASPSKVDEQATSSAEHSESTSTRATSSAEHSESTSTTNTDAVIKETASSVSEITNDSSTIARDTTQQEAIAAKQLDHDKRISQKEEQRHAEAMFKLDEVIDSVNNLGAKLGGNSGALGLDFNRKGKRKGKDIPNRKRPTTNGRRGQMYGRGGTASSGGLSLSSGVDTPESRSRASRTAGGRMGAAKGAAKGMFGSGLKMAGSLLSKAALPLAAGMAIFDGVSGFTDAEKQKETFNLKEGQEASLGQKMAMATGSIASFGGLTEWVGISSGDIAKGIYSLFGGDTSEAKAADTSKATEPKEAKLKGTEQASEAVADKTEPLAVPSDEVLASVVAGGALATSQIEPASFKERVAVNQEKITSVLLPTVTTESNSVEQATTKEAITNAKSVEKVSSDKLIAQTQANAQSSLQPAIEPMTDIEVMLNSQDSVNKTMAKASARAGTQNKPPAPTNPAQLKEMVTLLKSIDKTLKTSNPKQPTNHKAKNNDASVSANVPIDFSDSAHRRKANDYDF